MEYLQCFSKDLGLGSITQYNTSVEGLRKVTEGGKSVWKLLSRELSKDHLGRTVGTWSEEVCSRVLCGVLQMDSAYPDFTRLLMLSWLLAATIMSNIYRIFRDLRSGPRNGPTAFFMQRDFVVPRILMIKYFSTPYEYCLEPLLIHST